MASVSIMADSSDQRQAASSGHITTERLLSHQQMHVSNLPELCSHAASRKLYTPGAYCMPLGMSP